jgi:hypothetical protein
MKKTLVITNLFSIGLCLFIACNSGTQEPNGGIVNNSPCTDCFSPEVNNSLEGLISYQLALKMSKEYAVDKGKKYVSVNGAPTLVEDARYVWFNLKKLKNFIAYVERQACLANCDTSKRLGIRIYYAKYPTKQFMEALNSGLTTVPSEYADHHTVFLSPTYYDVLSKKNVDFDPQNLSKECIFQPIDPEKGVVWLGTPTNNQQNHGNIAPPPEGSGAFPVTPN